MRNMERRRTKESLAIPAGPDGAPQNWRVFISILEWSWENQDKLLPNKKVRKKNEECLHDV